MIEIHVGTFICKGIQLVEMISLSYIYHEIITTALEREHRGGRILGSVQP